MGFLYLGDWGRLENLYMRWHLSEELSRNGAVRPPRQHALEQPMLDILVLALGFGLFAVAIGYTYACERL